MGNLTSRHLQTLKPLSTIQFDLCVTGHDECVTCHALFRGVTLQIISAIMVTFCAVYCPHQPNVTFKKLTSSSHIVSWLFPPILS